MNPLTIKNLTIGEGRPKICVPITGATEKEILKEIDSPDIIYADLIEWRADCFLNVLQNEKLDETLTLLQTKQKNAPILFTCRTKEEGGSASISPKEYEALNDFVLSTKKPDLIDIQAYQQGTDIPKLIQTTKKQGIKVIASYHNFNQTPSKKEIIDRLRHMQNLGADLIKIPDRYSCYAPRSKRRPNPVARNRRNEPPLCKRSNYHHVHVKNRGNQQDKR